MFIYAHWSPRKETKEAAALRISTCLLAIGEHSEDFKTWFRKGRSRADALRRRIDPDPASIQRNLGVNRTEIPPRQIIEDLGFSFYAWNGKEASFRATVGCWCPRLGNSAELDVNNEEPLSKELYRTLLQEMIRAFDPENAVVTSSEHLARAATRIPWEAPALFTYTPEAGIQEHPFP